MVLHIFPNEKFTEQYIMKVNQLFPEGHMFFVYGPDRLNISERIKLNKNVYVGDLNDKNKNLIELSKRSNRIILHSIPSSGSQLLCIWNLFGHHKCMIWSVWGADLYNEYQNNRQLKCIFRNNGLIKEIIRTRIINNLYGVVTLCDYEELKKRYTFHGKVFPAKYSFDLPILVQHHNKSGKLNVMVGHSATKSCRHEDCFEYLIKYKNKVNVYCPLSYGIDHDYGERIKNVGYQIFGENFHPLESYLDYSDYMVFLNSIDIAIFNNNRQQGMGNITALLYLGKKVFLSHENTILNYYKKMGCYIYDVDDINSDGIFTETFENEAKTNRTIVQHECSDECFYEQWNRAFTE